MNSNSMLSKVGSWAFVLVGIGHLVTSTFGPDVPGQLEILDTMREFPITMLGTESNLFLFHEGFSLMMGLMLFGYGLLNLSLLRELSMPSSRMLAINVSISLVAFCLSLRNFFAVPVFLLGVASLCFVLAFAIHLFSRRPAPS